MPLDIVLELYEASWEDGTRLGALHIQSEEAAKIIAAADIPLAGWEQPIEPGWLSVQADPVVDYLTPIELRYRGDMQMEARRSERWIVATTGHVCRQVRDEYTNFVVATSKKYQFDESDALIRLESVDYVTNTWGRTPIQVRSAETSAPVTDEEALGVMAALLREFDQVRFSLSRPSIKQHDQLEAAMKRVLAKLSPYVAQRPRHPPVEIFQALCRRITEDLHPHRELIATLPRPTEARARFMGPLQVAFKLLFGKSATTTYDFVGETDKKEADSPFVRFVDAFFRATGCPCKKNTINSALRDWRDRNRPVKKRRVRKAARF